MNSALYVGRLRHRRHRPVPHAFEYPLHLVYLDLDELDRVFAKRWLWSTRARNVVEFRRSDFLGPATMPLADAVRDRVASATGHRPDGAVGVLTQLRTFGHSFNPVSFYYCHDANGALQAIVAEVTNTPWKERHAYVLPTATARPHGDALAWDFGKAFHVSPFLPMARDYRWRFTPPGARLHVHMDVVDGAERDFDATLTLERREITGASLAASLARFPFASLRVVAAIHWQALRLWLKKVPVHDHPSLHRPAGHDA